MKLLKPYNADTSYIDDPPSHTNDENGATPSIPCHIAVPVAFSLNRHIATTHYWL